jgi:hypothetical protein
VRHDKYAKRAWSALRLKEEKNKKMLENRIGFAENGSIIDSQED